jgi:hypothetical protein
LDVLPVNACSVQVAEFSVSDRVVSDGADDGDDRSSSGRSDRLVGALAAMSLRDPIADHGLAGSWKIGNLDLPIRVDRSDHDDPPGAAHGWTATLALRRGAGRN